MPFTEAGATALAGLASAAASAANNALNVSMTGRMNARSERMMRESWAREDNAVQRRVADLKAAGLSPTLAAGSAAQSSGPIKLNTPQFDFDGVVNHSLEAMSAVKALKAQDLENENKAKQNELLQKNIDAFGLPDWYNALVNIFGLEPLRDWLKGFGHGDSPQMINNIYESMMSGFNPGFKFAFTPNKSYTSGSSPMDDAVVSSVEESGGHVENNQVVFDSRAQARQWYLDIGGTTAEWYYGVKKYGSVEGFLDNIIGSGLWYFK